MPESVTQLLVLNQLLDVWGEGLFIAKVDVQVVLFWSSTELIADLLIDDLICFGGSPKLPVAPFHLSR